MQIRWTSETESEMTIVFWIQYCVREMRKYFICWFHWRKCMIQQIYDAFNLDAYHVFQLFVILTIHFLFVFYSFSIRWIQNLFSGSNFCCCVLHKVKLWTIQRRTQIFHAKIEKIVQWQKLSIPFDVFRTLYICR